MDEASANLGVCFFSDRLFYAINDPTNDKHLSRIGCFDFNFDVADAISNQHSEQFPHIKATFEKLRVDYNLQSVRSATYPGYECWTSLPKVVYDNADEREDHLAIIMKGIDRKDIEPTWHAVSKPEYKFLSIRRRNVMQGFDQLTEKVGTTEFASDFELATKWSSFNKPGGSFLMIGCHKDVISITSYLLGKFRASTFIKFDQIADLAYHWLQHTLHNNWMKGLHENIYLFGHETYEVEQTLHGLWDKSSVIINLNTLNEIGVVAEEETYGFDLAAAFPAILLSLDF
ncbi:MAG: hypothetical protein ED557_05145 [Balneola sp.]|nr:MAG: hypothetical protein ED557_05145 [Balneola sp.]